jgi:D-sedoheptulose 7-phosphate isomerase
MDYKKNILGYFSELKETIDRMNVEDIDAVLNLLVDALHNDRKIFIMGNGGSASTASHFVCDFNKGLSGVFKKRFRLICLNDNIPSVLAYANDDGYETVFVEQLKNFFESGDLVIGISGSGNSKNVLNAVRFANENGGVTIGISGYSGGELKKISKYNIHVPINNMQITEDIHMMLDHMMMTVLKNVKD